MKLGFVEQSFLIALLLLICTPIIFAHEDEIIKGSFIEGVHYEGGNSYFSDNFILTRDLYLIAILAIFSVFLIAFLICRIFYPYKYKKVLNAWKKTKSKTTIIIVFFIFIVLSIFIFTEYLKLGLEKSYFVIQTLNIQELYPHEHFIWEDNLLDHGFYFDNVIETPEDIWITGFNHIVNNAPQAIIHHSTMNRFDKLNPICPNLLQSEYIYGFSSEHQKDSIAFPESFAVFIPKNTQISFNTMLHNPYPPFGPGKTYKNVSVAVNVTFIKKSVFKRYNPLRFFLLHIDEKPCQIETWTFEVPPNSQNFTKKDDYSLEGIPSIYTFANSGEIFYFLGHTHPWEGGKKLTAYLNDKILMESIPFLAGQEPWSWTTPLVGPNPVPISKNDVLSISATYSNPSNHTNRGAMGVLMFYFAPDLS